MFYELFVSLANRFAQHGYHLYLIGGSSRDFLLKIACFDMDLVTDATPQTVLEILDDGDITFIKYGIVKYKYDNLHVDIATFRKESDYLDYRHPATIQFTTSMQEDAKRRDFTINAIYIDKDLNTYDFYGGLNDLKSGIIKTIGDPYVRFKEDPLRIFRCLRFALKTHFMLDEKTQNAAHELIYLLDNLNPQKVLEEINKMKKISLDETERILTEYHITFSK